MGVEINFLYFILWYKGFYRYVTLAFLRKDTDARKVRSLEVSGIVAEWKECDSDKQQQTCPADLTFMIPCIANVFSSTTNKMQRCTIYLFFVICSTCFRLFLRPSSEAKNCIYSIGYFVKILLLPATVVEKLERNSNTSTTVVGSNKSVTKYPTPYIHFWAPDDVRRNSLKHVEHIT